MIFIHNTPVARTTIAHMNSKHLFTVHYSRMITRDEVALCITHTHTHSIYRNQFFHFIFDISFTVLSFTILWIKRSHQTLYAANETET